MSGVGLKALPVGAEGSEDDVPVAVCGTAVDANFGRMEALDFGGECLDSFLEIVGEGFALVFESRQLEHYDMFYH